MIHFKSCEWKNFLSTGNDPIKILLDKSPTTLNKVLTIIKQDDKLYKAFQDKNQN